MKILKKENFDFNVKSILVTLVVLLVLNLALGFFGQLPFDVGYKETVFSNIAILTVISVIEIFWKDNLKITTAKLLLIDFIVLYFVIAIPNATMFNAEKYSSVIETAPNKQVEVVEEKDMRIKAVDTRTSTKTMALKAAKRVIGSPVDGVLISSQYSINKESAFIQEIKGKSTWVFPLDYRGFFKWLNQDTIPGYILVTATNDETRATLKLNKFKYSKKGYFGTNIDRKMWFASGFKKVSTHLEIDEEGKPYYIGSILKPSIGFNAYNVDTVIVVDALTGGTETLTPEVAQIKYPWIDRIIPEDIVDERITWYGSLKDGWRNSVFAQENIKKATSYNGAEYWFTKINNKNYWFTGVTSNTTQDQSLIGGIVVDTLTGEAKEFALSSVVDESGAIEQAESSLGADSIRWDAVLPQPQFVNGEFYWITTVKSDSNIFQSVIAVKGNDIRKVFKAKDVKSVINKIKNGSLTVESTDETITINKGVYLNILKKIEELNELTKKLK